MPTTIEPIDRIARRLQRDVLMLAFCNAGSNATLRGMTAPSRWLDDETRRRVLEWLDFRTIVWRDCLPFFTDGLIEYPYRGHVFVNLSFEPADPVYQSLVDFLENEDGRCEFPGVGFYVVRLKAAMGNAHHDGDAYVGSVLDG